jgi:hypothetical protein
MKKFFFLLTATLIVTCSFSTSTVLPSKKIDARTVFFPIGNTGKKISLMELSTINARDLQKLTGKKMNFAEKISFKVAQKRLSKSINKDGSVTNKKFQKLFQKREGATGFHLGGFALGFLLGLIGVLIAYLIKDEYKPNRVKWAWIGWAFWLVLLLIILIA